ncbi:MAG: four helix bundle suffix domain-containing protein [Bacteroidaceae bacterium]|nr:four helix bundle suffix domain-containing protein [Bacteroidaceae bacterium]
MSEQYFLRKVTNWKTLHFYRKAEALYQLTYAFTQRFLPAYGDRTVDQMVQSARSTTQNIIEGCEDGRTSTETEVKLLGIAKGSLQELLNDYQQYLASRNLTLWNKSHPRFRKMLDYCRTHNDTADFEPYFHSATAEELANIAITLCHYIDRMMDKHIANVEHTFVEEGGIKERMTAARLGRRKTQNETIEAQAHEIETLKTTIARQQTRIAELEAELTKWHNWWQENKHQQNG